MGRTIREKVIDRVLTLYVIDRCRTRHGIRNVSETKMHKLVFFSEKSLNERRYKALNYRFIKLLYPTYSEELRNDLRELVELNFLDGPYLSENKKAQMVLEDFHEVFSSNREIMDMIDSVVDTYARIRTETLVKKARSMPWKKGIIDDLRNGTPLVYPIKRGKAKRVFQISEENFEDLAICLSPKISRGMKQAFDELKGGRRLTHEEVFG